MPSTVDVTLKNVMNIEGALAAALVDYTSGMSLAGATATKDLDVTVAAAGNTEVIKAEMRTMELLGLDDRIEDVLITLGKQYHLMRPLHSRDGAGLFLYLALDRARGNLALARRQLQAISESLEL
jgi:VIT1/CCC1 family predicted Fe2+/Mn2+ transporter